jgi:major inositol transporter-like SP family MFS transporter
MPPRSLLTLLLPLYFLRGYAMFAGEGVAAAYAREFGLGHAQMAELWGWLGLGVLLEAGLGRALDRMGRRRVLLLSVAGFALGALGTAAAPTLPALVAAQVALEVFGGAMGLAIGVTLAEELATERRASGTALAGMVVQVGSGAALVVSALLVDQPGGWRLAWAAPALGLLGWPLLWLRFPETRQFAAAEARGETSRSRWTELFSPRYRGRTLVMLGGTFVGGMSVGTVLNWVVYYPETVLAVEPVVATAAVIGGGAVGLAGFALGARVADRSGRLTARLAFSTLFTVCGIAYYWVPGDRGLWTPVGLCVAFSLASIGWGGYVVAGRTLAAELYPTRLRGTISGLVAIVVGLTAISASFLTSWITSVTGDFRLAISAVAALGVVGELWIFFGLVETRGLGLEESPLDPEPDPARGPAHGRS